MKIEVYQIESEQKNEFEIKYDNNLKYKAKLPFVAINDPLNLEKIRNINKCKRRNLKIFNYVFF